ncbi:MAG: sigma-70 family RNA polymerase sigma factor, partial [Actinobacteria bacterium]|nr:sigma-70 family RNA polymerase sigma factor [Actinomycetota bacterium]
MATAIRSSDRPHRVRPTRGQIEPAAVALLERHGAQLMSTARRYAATPEDAEDAYQRGVEILLTKAPTTDPAELLPWLKTVVKHEAFAVRRQSERHGVPSELAEIEPLVGRDPGPADLAERRDRLRLGAEAMSRLKPQEVRALMLRAEGLSYQEICEATGWTYTKVNRCLSEGRRSFVERVAGIETGLECARVGPLLSALADGEATAADVARLRPHLRGCLACRARLREYRDAPSQVAALAPLGLVASLWELLRGSAHGASSWLQSRGIEVASRWEGVGEALATHKAAAVAASTLALAGGGAATVATLPRDPAHPRRAAADRR